MATITKRNGRWQARVRRKGFSTQTKTFSQKGDAERWVRQTEIQIETHELPRATPIYPTFEQAVTRYKIEVSMFKKSYHVEKYRLARLMALSWATKSMNQIDGQAISELRLRRLGEVSSATVRKELYLISAIYETASREWGLNALKNPVSGIRVPSGANPERSRITGGMLKKVLVAVNESNHRYLPHVIGLALETAMRRSEILSLTWQDIDKDKRLAYLGDTKNGHPRLIPLTDKALEAISHGDTGNEYIFPMTGNAVRLAWERLKRRHGIEGVRFHDLRHEAISRFFDMGLTVPEVASISGHRTVSMLFRYAHADIEVVRKRMTNKKV
jgi:integrase